MNEATKEAEKTSEDDFDAEDLFNTLTGVKDSTLDSDSVEESLGHEDEESNEDDATPTDEGDDGQAQEEEAEAQATGETETPEAQAEDESTDPEPEDIWSKASDEQREEFRRLQHEHQKLSADHRANAGRVQGYSKKVNELTKELDELKRKQAELVAKPEGSTGEELGVSQQDIQNIEQDYPEVAQLIRYHIQNAQKQTANPQLDDVTRKVNTVMSTLTEQQEREQQQAVRRELDYLHQAHPDYVEIRHSADFNNWINTRTNGVSPEVKNALVTSMSAQDNIDLLDMYKLHRTPVRPQATPQVKPAEKLQAHATLPKRGSPPPNSLPEDPVELFDLIVKQNQNRSA